MPTDLRSSAQVDDKPAFGRDRNKPGVASNRFGHLRCNDYEHEHRRYAAEHEHEAEQIPQPAAGQTGLDFHLPRAGRPGFSPPQVATTCDWEIESGVDNLPEGPVQERRYKWELLGLLCLAFFFPQGDRAIYGVVATEIQADLKLGKSQIGLIGAILFWTIAVMTPIAGYLGDMLRKKLMITGALLFWSMTTALTGLSSGFLSLALLRSVATGGSESFYAPPAYALLARFHQKTRALAMVGGASPKCFSMKRLAPGARDPSG